MGSPRPETCSTSKHPEPLASIINANLADYLVPVNADIPDLNAIYLDGEDREADPLGVKGLGELVMIGVAPAIANAVFNATGRRVRELPITAEALL